MKEVEEESQGRKEVKEVKEGRKERRKSIKDCFINTDNVYGDLIKEVKIFFWEFYPILLLLILILILILIFTFTFIFFCSLKFIIHKSVFDFNEYQHFFLLHVLLFNYHNRKLIKDCFINTDNVYGDLIKGVKIFFWEFYPILLLRHKKTIKKCI